MVRLEESFQALGLGDSQCGAPQLLRKLVPSFTKMSTLRLELPVLEVQRGPPHDLTKTVEFDTDLSLISEGFETALKNSFLAPHPMLSVQSSREN